MENEFVATLHKVKPDWTTGLNDELLEQRADICFEVILKLGILYWYGTAHGASANASVARLDSFATLHNVKRDKTTGSNYRLFHHRA
jgi:hypothetical protein